MATTTVSFVLEGFYTDVKQYVTVNRDGLIDCEVENMPSGLFFSLRIGKYLYSGTSAVYVTVLNEKLTLYCKKPSFEFGFNDIYASLKQVKINGKLKLVLACHMEPQQADGLLDFLCEHCGYSK